MKNRPNILLLSILTLAAGLRIYGLDWSLPHTYEEATPLRVAIGMWGWQANGPTTLNPQFFNYPSLTFYIHFLAQGVVFLCLRLAGEIKSVSDWAVLYLTNPTSQYIGSRLVGVCFGVATVFFLYKLARSVTTTHGALLGALLLATSPFHIARSQMIEVDIPLTFFVVLALYGVMNIIEQGRWRDYVLTGIAIGLATSAKYTGFFLAIPFIAAQTLTFKSEDVKPSDRWKRIVGAVFLAFATFAATSAYVLVDLRQSWAGLSVEREHMELGHFGVTQSAWRFYGHALTHSLLGLLGLAMGMVGTTYTCIKRSSKPALVLVIFCVIYVCVIATWSTKADRYLLPVFPPLLALAASGVLVTTESIMRALGRPQAATIAAVLLVLGLLTWNLGGIKQYRAEIQHDTRTDAQNWIESNLPSGAFIVTEGYGPDLLDPSTVLQLDPQIRKRVLERWRERPIFAVSALPMYQTHPERSAPFYTLSLYPDADYFITSSSIQGRYVSEPKRFREQTDFYAQLQKSYNLVREFSPRQPGGIHLAVYETSEHDRPFGARDSVTAPTQLQRTPENATGREAGFYFTMGTNYEYFHHPAEAAAAYKLALEYRTSNPQLFLQCVLGYTRCLVRSGHADEALQVLDQMSREIDDKRLKGVLAQLRGQIKSAIQRR